MALSGLDIFKLLPKTNCKKCGKPTCLAFAMALAQKKASLDECPDVSEEAKASLASAAAPPIRLVAVGTGDAKREIGQETVLYRHDEKFHHPTLVAVTLDDSLTDAELAERLDKINALQFDRVGQHIAVDMVAVRNTSGQPDAFAKAAELVVQKSRLVPLLMTESPEAAGAALEKCADKRPLLAGANADNLDAMVALAKQQKVPLAVTAPDLEALAALTEKAKAGGVEDLVVWPQADGVAGTLNALSTTRTAALKKTFRPLGYPPMALATDGDDAQQAMVATAYVCKYAAIVVVDTVEPWAVLPVLTARMNIFTDPQKPVQVEPKLYAVGEPDETSPVLMTTNFSLTYYTVESDVEASRVPSYILAVDTEGTSVLTAYSGDKLTDQSVKKAMADAKVEDVVTHRKMIIPGLVSVMSGALEEETGWEILVGPRESSVIPKYLQEVWKT